MKKNYVFGIDLGTTYSCIAYVDDYEKPVVLANSYAENTTPSVVYFASGNNIIVGKEAKANADVDKERVIQFIKRKMGKSNDTVVVDDKTYHAPEVSSYILKKLVLDANDKLRQLGVLQNGEDVKDVVITCPAYFGMSEREATKTAGVLAGLNVLDIINEPTAAAISYGASNAGKNENVLVYDLGGGTFDITVMNINNGKVTAICTDGDDTLGGKNWDEQLINYIAEKYEEEYGEDLTEDADAMAELGLDVEDWKKSLSNLNEVTIKIKGDAGRYTEKLSRDKYNEITKPLLNKTKNLLDKVLKTAEKQGYPLSSISKILLVGGSTKMPQVTEMIERDYKVKPSLQEPDEAVAKGAAIYTGNRRAWMDFLDKESRMTGKTVEQLEEENIISGQMSTKFSAMSSGAFIEISNVLSKTYGVEVINPVTKANEISNIIFANSPLPVSNEKMYSTATAGQTGVEIKIYETNSMENTIPMEGRKPITVITMTFNTRLPADTPFSIIFSFDNSGLLHIVAEEKHSHSRLDTTFNVSNSMSDQDISMALKNMSDATIS